MRQKDNNSYGSPTHVWENDGLPWMGRIVKNAELSAALVARCCLFAALAATVRSFASDTADARIMLDALVALCAFSALATDVRIELRAMSLSDGASSFGSDTGIKGASVLVARGCSTPPGSLCARFRAWFASRALLAGHLIKHKVRWRNLLQHQASPVHPWNARMEPASQRTLMIPFSVTPGHLRTASEGSVLLLCRSTPVVIGVKRAGYYQPTYLKTLCFLQG